MEDEIFMGNKLKVEIAETAEELKQQLRRQKKGQEKERLQMLYWRKAKEAVTKCQINESQI